MTSNVIKERKKVFESTTLLMKELIEAKVTSPKAIRKWSWFRSRSAEPDNVDFEPLLAESIRSIQMDLSDFQRIEALAPPRTQDSLTRRLFRSNIESQDAGDLNAMNLEFNPTFDCNLMNQLVLTTRGSNLALHDFTLENDTEIIRRRIDSDNVYQSHREYFCILEVPPLLPTTNLTFN